MAENKEMIIPVILAGGSGTRLWPLSRELYPKQLLPLVDSNRTLLQDALLRLSGFEGMGAPLIVCNENHRFLVAEQCRSIGVQPAAIILEPVGRNTAPAIAVAAQKVQSLYGDGVLLVLPSDHHIESIGLFHECLQTGAYFSRAGYLVAFGVQPSSPETAFGYIQRGEMVTGADPRFEALHMLRFVEKPSLKDAREYVDSGTHYWNSGMFMFLASRILDEMNHSCPQIVASCTKAIEDGTDDLDFFRLSKEPFEACPGDSIDCAVMERTTGGVVVPLHARWSDLSSWDALWQIGKQDSDGNVTIGDVLIQNAKHCYLHATSRLVAALGVENHVIVETPDAVLVAPWEKVHDVTLLVDKLKAANREEAISHRKVYRPWGTYDCVSFADRFQVKRIMVKPGAKLSLQKHHHRAEHWVVVHGTALVTKGDEQFLLREDESTYIPLGVDHRLENPGKIPLELIEVQSGSYLGEDDIVRFNDIYGRQS